MMQSAILDFLWALGNAVLHSFWQMALLWLIIAALIKYRPHMAAVTVSSMAFSGLAVGFLAFITTFLLLYFSPQHQLHAMSLFQDGYASENFIHASAILYIIILMVLLTRLAASYRKILILKNTCLNRPPGHYKIFLLDAVQYLGIKKKVALWVSELADAPLTIGFLKPVILLPVAIVNHLSTTQVEAIILHELAHIKRHDYLLNFMSQFMVTILYFNPFAKALLQMQNTETEKNADEKVLQFEYNHQLYASTLLHLARQNNLAQANLALQAASARSPLYYRILSIMGQKKRNVPATKKIWAAFGATLILFIGSVFFTTHHSIDSGTATAIGTISFNPAVAFADNSYPKVTQTSSQEIPATRTATTFKNKTLYRKQIQNAEIADAEILTPYAPEKNIAYIYVHNDAPNTLPITNEQEQNVQQYIALAKKILVENNWLTIEHSLAESVTTDQKVQLKNIFNLMMDAIDWSAQASMLRAGYNSIDWRHVLDDARKAVADIQLDSIYNHYSTALEKYQSLKQEIGEIKSLQFSDKIAEAEKILQRADSLRRKRLVDL